MFIRGVDCINQGVKCKKGVIRMLIAICDDESILCNSLKNDLYNYFNIHNIDTVIDTYTDGNSLINSKAKYDLIFLDYQMPGINGLQTAQKIRNKNNLCTILFLTNYPEIVYDTFKFDTFRFLIKPLNKNRLIEALDSFRKKIEYYYPISISIDGDTYKIDTRKIIYVEANGKNSIIRLKEQSFHCPKTLSNVFSLLPKNCFYKTHRSYVVNFAYIDKYNKCQIKFTNGEYAKISRNIFFGFQNALNTYINDIAI